MMVSDTLVNDDMFQKCIVVDGLRGISKVPLVYHYVSNFTQYLDLFSYQD